MLNNAIGLVHDHSRAMFYGPCILLPVISLIMIMIAGHWRNRLYSIALAYTSMVVIVIGAIYLAALSLYLFGSPDISFWENAFMVAVTVYYIIKVRKALWVFRLDLRANRLLGNRASDGAAFVSYRTTEAPWVRLLVEQLLARRVPIWFDEYNILADKKGGVLNNLKEFDELIKKAIAVSAKGICFIGKDYIDSDYCMKEAKLLVANPGVEKILLVNRDTAARVFAEIPELNRAVAIENNNAWPYITNAELNNLWQSLLTHCGVVYSPLALEHDDPDFAEMVWSDGCKYYLDVGGWNGVNVQEVSNVPGLDVVSGRYSREICGKTLFLNIVAGLKSGAHRKKIADRRTFIVDVGEEFDKFVHQSPYMTTAVAVGYHFIPVDGVGHAAFTTFDRLFLCWQRHYVIVVDNPVRNRFDGLLDPRSLKKDPNFGKELEISLQFTMKDGASFEEFIACGYLMDRVAMSVRI